MGKNIQKIIFVSNAQEMIPKVFRTRFDDFCFSRSPNPLHDSMYKVWAKKIENLFFVSYAM
jgi:hypothetical protein